MPANPYRPFEDLQARGRVTVLGDLHGKLRALEAILAERGVEEELAAGRHHVVSVGDVVDRGPRSESPEGEFFPGAEAVLDRFAQLKSRYPDRVWMTMGNHEQQHLQDIVDRKLAPGGISQWGSQGRIRLTPLRLDFLRSLPLAIRLQVGDVAALVVHGGPSRTPLVLAEARADGPLELLARNAWRDVLWGYPAWSMSGQGSWYSFTRPHVERFLAENNASVLIRGHRDEDQVLGLGAGCTFVSVHSAKGPKGMDVETDGYAYLAWDPPGPPRLVRRPLP